MTALWGWVAMAAVGLVSSAALVSEGAFGAWKPCDLCEGVRRASLPGPGAPGEARRLRNEALNGLYRDHADELSRGPGRGPVDRFNSLLKRRQLATFGDVLEAEALWRKGAGGTGIVEGRGLEAQPAYREALRLLEEHSDFFLAGIPDPELDFGRIPDGFREEARRVYARLNPEGRFAGGFDHPLYLAVLREATLEHR